MAFAWRMGMGWQAAGGVVNVVAMAGLLRGEAARLPLQNVVALGVVSMGLGAAGEGWMARVGGAVGEPVELARWATGWPVAWLGARAMARRMGGTGLAWRTLALGVLMLPGWDGVVRAWVGVGEGVGVWGWVAAMLGRAAWMPAGMVLLAPWWIRKQMSPPRPVPWLTPWLGPGAVVVQGLLGAWATWAGPGR